MTANRQTKNLVAEKKNKIKSFFWTVTVLLSWETESDNSDAGQEGDEGGDGCVGESVCMCVCVAVAEPPLGQRECVSVGKHTAERSQSVLAGR